MTGYTALTPKRFRSETGSVAAKLAIEYGLLETLLDGVDKTSTTMTLTEDTITLTAATALNLDGAYCQFGGATGATGRITPAAATTTMIGGGTAADSLVLQGSSANATEKITVLGGTSVTVLGTSVILDGNATVDGDHTFGTGTGAVSLNGSVVLATTKTYTSGTGSAIGGTHIIYRTSGAKSFEVIPGTKVDLNETNINLTGIIGITGAVTASGDLIVNGGDATITETADGASGAELNLSQVSASPTADDDVGIINFLGKDNVGSDTETYAQVMGCINDPTNDAEFGSVRFLVLNGTGATPIDSGRVYNDGSYGYVAAGNGGAAGIFASVGDYDVVLQSGNSTTGTITITNGASGAIALAPNGTGIIKLDGAVTLDDDATLTDVSNVTTLTQNTITLAGSTKINLDGPVDLTGKLALDAQGGDASVSGLLIGIGTAGTPATDSTADGKFVELRCETTATSGDCRLQYMRYYMAGINTTGGECLKAGTVLEAAVGTARGGQASIEVSSAGYVSGFAAGWDALLEVADSAVPSGTYTGGQSQIYMTGSSSDLSGTTHSIHRFSVIGGDATAESGVKNAFSFDVANCAGSGAGNMISLGANEGATTGTIRILVNGAVRYIAYTSHEGHA